MMNQIKKFLRLIDSLNLQYKMLILAVLIVFGLLLWYNLIAHSLWQEASQINRDIKTTRAELAQLETTAQQLKNTTPSGTAKRLVACNTNGPSANMISVLHNILETQRDLTLIELKNLPEEPATESTLPKGAPLYKHKIYFKFSGEYFAVLAYLQSLENQKWCLNWDKFDYKVTTYPTAEVTLVVHTTSDKEGFLYV